MKQRLACVMAALSAALVSAATPEPMQYGRAFLAEGDAAAAIGSYTEALRLNPVDPVALNNLAVAKVAAGDYQSALALLAQAGQLAPNRADIQENLTNLRAWHRAYVGASTAVTNLDFTIAEPPPLWGSTLPGLPSPASATGKPNLAPLRIPNCQNRPCK